jgi:hypothetical protein
MKYLISSIVAVVVAFLLVASSMSAYPKPTVETESTAVDGAKTRIECRWASDNSGKVCKTIEIHKKSKK